MATILQITDLHLYAKPGGRLLGQDTRRTFEAVLTLAQNSGHWPPDAIFLTGDLVHDEGLAGYGYLNARMAALGVPCHALPGNHDRSDLMERAFHASAIDLRPRIVLDAWQILFLDSTIPGEEGGHLGERQLTFLRRALEEHPHRPTLIGLHHQPVPVASRWLDTMALDDAPAFFALVDAHPQVRGILFGHIHQAFQETRNGVRLLGAPSTCIQFLPGSREFALDRRTPGFRWLCLASDGGLRTGIERIPAYPDPLDLASDGY